MVIKVDRRIYSDECISKVVYWYSGKYAINRFLESDNIELIQFNQVDDNDSIDIEKSFMSKLNDFKLRQIIEEETHDIRTVLYAKAFERYID